jgi:hypothetical protein
MTTATTNTANETQTTTNKNTVICVCCVAFFPVVYLVGSTVVNFFG